jgi:hypothetical protein
MSFWKLIALVYLLQEVCDVFLEADCLGVSLALQEIHQGNQLPKRHCRPPARDTPWQLASKKTSQTSCKRYIKAISFQKDIAHLLQERRSAMSFWKLIALVYLLQEVCNVFLEADCLGVSLAGGLRFLFGS